MTQRVLVLGLVLLSACKAVDDRNGGDPSLDPGAGAACLLSGVTAQLATKPADKLDLVFVVDNSVAMAEEQAALRAELPRMLRSLTTGDADGDGSADFPAARDLQLAVVSSDLGMPGIDGIPQCTGFGDNGLLNAEASADVDGCSAERFEPSFLSYSAEDDDLERVATDLGCLTTLGTDGCGIEQPLESMLKAVWPAENMDVWFLSAPDGTGGVGQGGESGPNGAVVRYEVGDAPSLVVFVLLTDEDDCSMGSTSHFRVDGLAADDPLRTQGLSTRCFHEAQLDRDPNQPEMQSNLYGPGRYVAALRALRPGREDRVVFAAIVGVPPDLVEAEDLAAVDFASAPQVNAFYDGILSDSRMFQTLDEKGTVEPEDDELVPSCDRGENQRAYPPRRIVEVARGFGESGIVQSICEDDLGPAIDNIVSLIGRQLAPVCLPAPVPRGSDGTIECDMIWDLPRADIAPDGAPVACDDHPLLSKDDTSHSSRGGERCTLPQLAIDQSSASEPEGDGWYYDDFSDETELCAGGRRQRIAFTQSAQPPPGVEVYLSCLNEIFALPPQRDDAARDQPRLGDRCDPSVTESCSVALADGSVDDAMSCNEQLRVCELACEEASDCPDAWVCEESLCRPPECRPGPEVSSSASVGDPCFPYLVPSAGFDDSELYVQPESDDCGGAACLVYHLGGDPREDCLQNAFGCVPGEDGTCAETARCASEQEIEERIYCSCRCDAPEGFATCDCPSDFTCVKGLVHGPEGAQGSYCVRNSAVAN